MPGITLNPADAAELAETLTFLTQWLSGSQKQALAESFTAFIGRRAVFASTWNWSSDTFTTGNPRAASSASQHSCSSSSLAPGTTAVVLNPVSWLKLSSGGISGFSFPRGQAGWQRASSLLPPE
jgi:hypothetical protein